MGGVADRRTEAHTAAERVELIERPTAHGPQPWTGEDRGKRRGALAPYGLESIAGETHGDDAVRARDVDRPVRIGVPAEGRAADAARGKRDDRYLPAARVLSRYPTPVLPMMNAREPGSSRGPVEPRSRSAPLSAAASDGAKNPLSRSVGVRRMTALPKSKLDVELPLPVAT